MPPKPAREQQPPAASAGLRVTVVNGDLNFVAEPIMVGHYTSSRLTGTERLLDRRIGGSMQRALDLGLYPSTPRTSQVFENVARSAPGKGAREIARPRAVIVVGLGEEGALTGTALSQSVRHGVLSWAQHVAHLEQPPDGVTLAATLLGSGGIGVGVGEAAQLIVQGVLDANHLLRTSALPVVGQLRLIELYLDRATEAWRSLRIQERASGGAIALDDAVRPGRGPLKRPLDAGYRGTHYDIVRTTMDAKPGGDTVLAFTVSTRRARSEVQASSAQVKLVRQLVDRASNRPGDAETIGQTLWDLLIPAELEPLLTEASELQMEVTPATAGIPWEVLESRRALKAGMEPWAIRTKLVRKLRTDEYRKRVVEPGDEGAVLVIGDPLTKLPAYPSLGAARREAATVERLLNGFAGRAGRATNADGLPFVEPLFDTLDRDDAGANADGVIKALFERPWRVVHICAHGEEPPPLTDAGTAGATSGFARGPSRGVVLSDGLFLGPQEIRSLRVVPELVFLNCCHLARAGTDTVLAGPSYDRTLFAASMADALVQAGVRCVVAAGWAVEEEASRAFAEAFYGALLEGRPFIDAVAAARIAARAVGGTTWAAYQCYGDPDWTLRGGTGDAQRPALPPEEEFIGIGSPAALRLVLHTLTTQTEFQGADPKAQADKLAWLERTFGERWGKDGAVAESFGRAWGKVGNLRRAVRWYERARGDDESRASLKAVEQLANFRARHAWQAMQPALKARSRVRKEAGAKAGAMDVPLARRADAARAEIRAAIALLEWLMATPANGDGPRGARSAERESLLGACYKRLGMLEQAMGERGAAREAFGEMLRHFESAMARCRADGSDALHFPAMNVLASALALDAGRAGWRGLDPALVALVRQALQRCNATDADFWSLAGEIELTTFEAVAARDLHAQREAIEREWTDLRSRAYAGDMWRSVHDQAELVLGSYARRASGAERAAARALLRFLRPPAAHA